MTSMTFCWMESSKNAKMLMFSNRITHCNRRLLMSNLADNYLVRFMSISKKKDGIFANYKVKGIRGGTSFSTSIAVDISAAEVDPSETLEKIISECARLAVREIKKSELQFEGMMAN